MERLDEPSPNPVPPPPRSAADASFWVEKTFPVGTILELQEAHRFETASEDWWLNELDAIRRKSPLVRPQMRSYLWPKGQRAEVLYVERRKPPFVLRGSEAGYFIARLLEPKTASPQAPPAQGDRVRALESHYAPLRTRGPGALGAGRIYAKGETGILNYLNERDARQGGGGDLFAEVVLDHRSPSGEQFVMRYAHPQTLADFLADWERMGAWDDWRQERGDDDDPILILMNPEDFVRVQNGRPHALWMPTTDTWGTAPAPLGRHHLPRSQRSWLKPNPIPPPPAKQDHLFDYIERTFPIGTRVRVVALPYGDGTFRAYEPGHIEEMRQGARPVGHAIHHRVRLPLGTLATVTDDLRGPGGRPYTMELALRLERPRAGNAPELAALFDELEGEGFELDDDELYVLARPDGELTHLDYALRSSTSPLGKRVLVWEPTTDTWGAAPQPLGRHHLPRRQRSWLKPNEGSVHALDIHVGGDPDEPDWVPWLEDDEPTEELEEVEQLLEQAGAFETQSEAYVSEEQSGLDITALFYSSAEALEAMARLRRWATENDWSLDTEVRRVEGDEDAEPAENPVPAPPSGVLRQQEWIERTFPIGAPMRSEYEDTFVALSPDEVEEVVRSKSMVLPPGLLLRFPKGTRAEVQHVKRDRGGDITLLARLPAPVAGLADPELIAAFDEWEASHPGAPLVLALQTHDLIRLPSPGAGRSRTAAAWWPLTDTWGAAPRPRTRYRP